MKYKTFVTRALLPRMVAPHGLGRPACGPVPDSQTPWTWEEGVPQPGPAGRVPASFRQTAGVALKHASRRAGRTREAGPPLDMGGRKRAQATRRKGPRAQSRRGPTPEARGAIPAPTTPRTPRPCRACRIHMLDPAAPTLRT